VVSGINTMTFAAKGFFARTRRERRSIPAAGCDGANNEVWAKKTCRPAGCAEFGLVASLLVGYSPKEGMRPPRASPQPKLGATNVIVFMPETTKPAKLDR